MYGLKYLKMKTSTINLIIRSCRYADFLHMLDCVDTLFSRLTFSAPAKSKRVYRHTLPSETESSLCKIRSYLSSLVIWDQGNCNCKLRSPDILTNDGSESNNWKRETKLLGFLQRVALLLLLYFFFKKNMEK